MKIKIERKTSRPEVSHSGFVFQFCMCLGYALDHRVDENTMLIEIVSAAKYTTRCQGCYILAV